jgi:hypothetical protein
MIVPVLPTLFDALTARRAFATKIAIEGANVALTIVASALTSTFDALCIELTANASGRAL